jgi:plastocyanin
VKTTTLTFDKPGPLTFICHFPQHEAYGMAGVVVVKP